jgi:hypothetical protein
VGRTVLISFEPEGNLNVFIEGQSPGVCPLRQIDQLGSEEVDAAEDGGEAASEGGVGGGNFNLPWEDLAHFLSMPVSAAVYRNGSAPSIQDLLQLASNVSNLSSMLRQGPVGLFDGLSAREDVREVTDNLTASLKDKADEAGKEVQKMALGSVGLEEKFVAGEVKLIESLIRGEGINDHFEDRYYRALEMAFADLKQRREGG